MVPAPDPSEGASPRIRRVVPDLQSDDPAGTGAFYTEVVGLEVAMDLGWILGLVSPSNPTAQLQILREDPAGVVPDLTIEVDDVAAVHARAVARGAPIVYPLTRESWGVRRFFVEDPGGRVLNVMEHGDGS